MLKSQFLRLLLLDFMKLKLSRMESTEFQILSHVHVVKTFNLFHGHIIMHENIFCPENTLHIKKLWSYGALTIDE